MFRLKLFYVFTCLTGFTFADYRDDRKKLIELEKSRALGASIVLNQKEEIANRILMKYKLTEYDEGFQEPGIFAPGRHFFQSRKDIEKSKVFDFIKKVPKGAALHGHDTSLVSEEFLYSLTFKDNLYACTVNNRLRLRFMLHADQDKTCNWTLISILRQRDPNYDNWVRSQLTLSCENPKEIYTDINQVWRAFQELFATIDPVALFRPVFEEYFYRYLQELYEDNVMYAEIRGNLEPVYELNGFVHGPIEIVGLYSKVFQKFKKDFPDFLGARLIYAPIRRVTNNTVNVYVETLKAISASYPDVVAGFDLVGQEDLGYPLSEFVEQLLPISLNYSFFFHAGETNWHGSTTDFNLFDAILLGTKRIGHGFALAKHPQLLDIVKKRQIAIEVCPISNQVLMLVEDMRNHPAASLIADGYPVIISADDPGFWSTKGLSYDFYMAFMGIASRNSDLRLLKQLSLNSLHYSAIPEGEKKLALKAWQEKWNIFIDKIIQDNS